MPFPLPRESERSMVPLKAAGEASSSCAGNSRSGLMLPSLDDSPATGDPVPASATWRVTPESAIAGDAPDAAMSETRRAMAARYAMNPGFKSLSLQCDAPQTERDRCRAPSPSPKPASGSQSYQGRLACQARGRASYCSSTGRRPNFVGEGYSRPGGGLNPGAVPSGAIEWMSPPGVALVAGPTGTVACGTVVAAEPAVGGAG